ncbi:hypothetical protein BJ085DRAFT_40505 [Dimargaris cristalligena]|uniref:RxLR effector protein n=1 Tax=Dimargaris cristalligena TaxID=215637 RepID=A0A4P9ZJT0_9FUNG|nr:hypothetical protein BJ085DRAFT_40505 [Dimargaris cristalligena]|eukprot:RKP33298.1 hypothetical protein BJ085DRAFT_40505 [Dimargaris cristalligena]
MRFAIITLTTLTAIASVLAHSLDSHEHRTPISQHLVRRTPLNNKSMLGGTTIEQRKIALSQSVNKEVTKTPVKLKETIV